MRILGQRQQRYTLEAAGLAAPKRRRRKSRKVLRPLWAMTLAAGIGLGSLAAFQQGGLPAFPLFFAPAVPNEPARLVAAVRPMPICGGGKRISCVVDGDTFWIDGEKVRIASIDAPEVQGRCQRERDLARRATERLSGILSTGGFQLTRTGVDRYGRTLALVDTGRGEAGAILVREGLAKRWEGRKAEWCF